MATTASDVRFALRSWRKSPGLTAIAVASIGLGIGAATTVFTLVDQVLLRALPVRAPHELVQLTPQGESYGNERGDGSELSYPMYEALRDRATVFSGMLAMVNFPIQVAESVQPERITGELVSGTYFPLLGVRAAAGRLLGPDDDRVPGGHPVVVLSHAFWTSRFAADASAVGRPLTINGRQYTIVGVAQPGFEGLELGRPGGPAACFIPMMMKPQVTPAWNHLDRRLTRWVRVFGRLRPGVSAAEAEAALQPLFRAQVQLDLADPGMANASPAARERHAATRVAVEPGAQGRSRFRQSLKTPLWVLMATGLGVLLIACANVANLLLARGVGRAREMAVRLAIGATRGRLVRQLLVESVMLSIAGGLFGLLLSAFLGPLVLGLFVNPETPSPVSGAPDLRVFAFALGLAALTGAVFGLAPALRSTRPDLAPTLKENAASVQGGGARLRKALVASQVAVSVLMVLGAGLFLRTLDNLLAVDVGFAPESLVSFTLDPSLSGYGPAPTKQLATSLLERLGAAPGAASASLSSIKLLDGNRWTADIRVEGRDTGEDGISQYCNAVGPGFFRTLGIPVLRGREFDPRDVADDGDRADGTPPFRVAVVNQRFARHYFGNENPLGRRLGFGIGATGATPIEIVGVVADSRYRDVREEVERQIFFPYLQSSYPGSFTVYLRTSEPPAAAFATAREVVRQLDPNLPIAAPRTLRAQVERAVSRERLVATMSTAFGSLATLLAVVGLYGVMAYAVSRRTREIGVRMALGARTPQIRWMVLRETLRLSAAGLAAAVPVAWWLGRLVQSQLYGVSATDPLTVAGAVGLLAAVSLAAGLVPSSRAARVQPTTALRYE
jgi:predicted permease